MQTLHTYGAFVYENEPLSSADRIKSNPHGVAKLRGLKTIMEVSERAPFQFALSDNFVEDRLLRHGGARFLAVRAGVTVEERGRVSYCVDLTMSASW